MFKQKRKRIITNNDEEEKEEIYMSLKTRLSVLDDLNDVYKDDETMQGSIQMMKEELKTDIETLISSGVDIMDLYKRFGAVLFKSKILQGQEAITKLTKGKEKNLTDLVQEDRILQERLNRINDPRQQALYQRMIAPNQGIFVNQRPGFVPPPPLQPQVIAGLGNNLPPPPPPPPPIVNQFRGRRPPAPQIVLGGGNLPPPPPPPQGGIIQFRGQRPPAPQIVLGGGNNQPPPGPPPQGGAIQIGQQRPPAQQNLLSGSGHIPPPLPPPYVQPNSNQNIRFFYNPPPEFDYQPPQNIIPRANIPRPQNLIPRVINPEPQNLIPGPISDHTLQQQQLMNQIDFKKSAQILSNLGILPLAQQPQDRNIFDRLLEENQSQGLASLNLSSIHSSRNQSNGKQQYDMNVLKGDLIPINLTNIRRQASQVPIRQQPLEQQQQNVSLQYGKSLLNDSDVQSAYQVLSAISGRNVQQLQQQNDQQEIINQIVGLAQTLHDEGNADIILQLADSAGISLSDTQIVAALNEWMEQLKKYADLDGQTISELDKQFQTYQQQLNEGVLSGQLNNQQQNQFALEMLNWYFQTLKHHVELKQSQQTQPQVQQQPQPQLQQQNEEEKQPLVYQQPVVQQQVQQQVQPPSQRPNRFQQQPQTQTQQSQSQSQLPQQEYRLTTNLATLISTGAYHLALDILNENRHLMEQSIYNWYLKNIQDGMNQAQVQPQVDNSPQVQVSPNVRSVQNLESPMKTDVTMEAQDEQNIIKYNKKSWQKDRNTINKLRKEGNFEAAISMLDNYIQVLTPTQYEEWRKKIQDSKTLADQQFQPFNMQQQQQPMQQQQQQQQEQVQKKEEDKSPARSKSANTRDVNSRELNNVQNFLSQGNLYEAAKLLSEGVQFAIDKDRLAGSGIAPKFHFEPSTVRVRQLIEDLLSQSGYLNIQWIDYQTLLSINKSLKSKQAREKVKEILDRAIKKLAFQR